MFSEYLQIVEMSSNNFGKINELSLIFVYCQTSFIQELHDCWEVAFYLEFWVRPRTTTLEYGHVISKTYYIILCW